MPSKSSSHLSLIKLRGFHSNYLLKRKSQVSSSRNRHSTVSVNPGAVASTSYSNRYCQTPSTVNKPSKSSDISHLKYKNKYLREELRKINSKSDKAVLRSGLIKVDSSKKSFKQFCTAAYKHLRHNSSLKKKSLLIGDLLISKSNVDSDNSPNENQLLPADDSITIKAIKYKCKILQLHNSKCDCSSPRLHVYLTTNHRCSDTCHIKSYPSIQNMSNNFRVPNPVKKYIFTTMGGKVKGKRTVKNKVSSAIESSVKNVAKNQEIVINKNTKEPQSELLEEECESLPAIMSSLSGDVEYVVLDDNTFNLNAKGKDKDTVKQDTIVTKYNSDLENRNEKSVTKNSKTKLGSKKSGKKVTSILERYLSETSYQTTKSKNAVLPPTTKIKTEQEDSSSLAEVCTNHCPSIKDIFGDINIKEEPVDLVDNNGMTVDDFSQEIKKLTSGSTSKSNYKDSNAVSSKHSQETTSSKGLFAGLIKEEVKTNEDIEPEVLIKQEDLPKENIAIKVEDTSSDSAYVCNEETTKREEKNKKINYSDTDNYSSDDSLGPLQIDEGEQPLPTVPTNALNFQVAQPNALLLPSVNIISPFKIKIFFGSPQNIQVTQPHELFNAANISTAIEEANKALPIILPKPTDFSDSPVIDIEEPEVAESVPKSMTCIYCNTVSPDVPALAKHFEDHQKEGLIICYFCQKSFGDKTGMKRHMRTHTGEKPYQCKVCGKKFSLPGNFKKHRDIHEDIRTEPCEICGKTFRRKEHLKYHMRTHTGEKPYTCTECGTSFTARYSLQIHMNIHLGKKPYKCTYCPKAFSDKSTMRKHIRVHTGEKPFHCEKCGRSFGESGTLAAHMATHRSDRPFKCKQCPLSFKTTGGLRQHEKIHTGEKQYACKFCGVKFLQKYNMTMHERIHTGEKPYSCPHCERSFRSRSCLAKHAVLHGGEEERRYECEHCNSRFYRKAHLRRHIDTHLGIKHHECGICSKKFCARATLESHIKTFHTFGARKFPCFWCGRVFKRKVYVNTHECIRDPAKVEKYKQELRALASSSTIATKEAMEIIEDPNNIVHNYSLGIKSEPEDGAVREGDDLREVDSAVEIGNHECTMCSQKFLARALLDHHMKTFHSLGIGKYPCYWCDRVFKRRDYVDSHECIRDPAKVEKYKQELRALVASSNNTTKKTVEAMEDTSNNVHNYSLGIKTEPEDDAAREGDGLGAIDSVVGNVDFDMEEDNDTPHSDVDDYEEEDAPLNIEIEDIKVEVQDPS